MTELSDSERREKRIEWGQGASELLAHPFFGKLITHLVAEQVKVLAGNPIGSLTATEAHATLRALELLKSQLKTFEADGNLAKKGK